MTKLREPTYKEIKQFQEIDLAASTLLMAIDRVLRGHSSLAEIEMMVKTAAHNAQVIALTVESGKNG